MLELVKNHSQKSAIFLRETEYGTLATFVVFDLFNNAKFLGKKILTAEESQNLREQRENLESQNVYIIEETLSEGRFLLKGEVVPTDYTEIENLIPSPYVSNLFREAEFFSTQKTRGPNK